MEEIVSDYIKGIAIASSGIGVTLEITFGALIIGSILGLLLAFMKMSDNKLMKMIASGYIEIIRGTPLIVQALIIYAGLPALLATYGISFRWEQDIMAGILACGLNSAAYVAEIFRSGLKAVDKGQIEAANSLGMNHYQTLRYITIPQAFKIVLPALGNEFITLIKETAVLSVIAIVDITRRSMLWAASSFMAWQAYIGTAVVYFALTFTISRLVLIMERRMALSDKR